ncbi:ribosome-assembly protein 3-domain-containing protein [Xylogone sp. PMI_703]|nr:ribosome-assembly protein 3-domain-containing protein [Xylogone sp. PMI_703]
MAPKKNNSNVPKRHKKRKCRTEVSSDSDSSDPEQQQQQQQQKPDSRQSTPEERAQELKEAPKATAKSMSDSQVTDVFTRYYMQRATKEFSEDLDLIRGAGDFKDEALPILINALQQGTSTFSMEERRRIAEAVVEEEAKHGGS